jgi:hypothetical protein
MGDSSKDHRAPERPGAPTLIGEVWEERREMALQSDSPSGSGLPASRLPCSLPAAGLTGPPSGRAIELRSNESTGGKIQAQMRGAHSMHADEAGGTDLTSAPLVSSGPSPCVGV